MGKRIKCSCNEPISAFSFRTAKAIEQIILKRIDTEITDYQILQGRILNFRNIIEASSNASLTTEGKQYLQTILYMYEEYFNITTQQHDKE